MEIVVVIVVILMIAQLCASGVIIGLIRKGNSQPLQQTSSDALQQGVGEILASLTPEEWIAVTSGNGEILAQKALVKRPGNTSLSEDERCSLQTQLQNTMEALDKAQKAWVKAAAQGAGAAANHSRSAAEALEEKANDLRAQLA